ncbi:MAG: ribosome small subunit-dependent GTPase A [Firmicutes bacterium]|nr:ribosome small subunit-dependent GTPase A [Bacillota bacterium]
MQGQIIKINSDLHFVSFEGEVYPCKCRGLFRKEHITPLVGDYVLFDKDKKLIEKVCPRKNEFKRPKVSNIDQAFLITSLVNPNFSLNLLDKLIVLMELHNVEPIICITKEDLMNEQELKDIREILKYYEKIGYKVVSNQDLDSIKKLLYKKTSVFTGQTGAGKSTLLNKLNPNWNLETGEVSLALGRGKHTTRVVEMFELFDGKVMDTPGFSALDFMGYTNEEIRDSFIEFKKYPCPFKDCLHTKEEECLVKKAVNDNNILESRYINYLNFIKKDVR